MSVRYNFLFVLLCVSLLLSAEPIRPKYYDHIDGKSDKALKDALYDSIHGGVRYQYGTTQYHSTNNPPQWKKGDLKAYGTWQAFPLTDLTDEGTVWDMYSNSVRYYPYTPGESGCGLNIEHCFPKSWWGGADNDAYKDLYHLNPSDARANQTGKSDFPPGIVDSIVKFDNGSLRQGYMKGHPKHRVYEPADEYKGDFARAYFYIVTAYQDFTWADKYSAYLTNDDYLVFQPWLKDLLLAWHRQDPVSEKEINRQHIISSIQHNRNPYIDYPDLVEYIWGNKRGEQVRLADLYCTEDTSYEPTEREPYCFCPDNMSDCYFDTLISLPSTSLSALKAVPNAIVSDKVKGNGTAAVVLGASSTDGFVQFDQLSVTESAYLILRASPFNSSTSMQLDISADDNIVESIKETVEQETRNEEYYVVTIPAGTRSIKVQSVGGSTAQRACLQELYLLLSSHSTALTEVFNQSSLSAHTHSESKKIILNGNIYILNNQDTYKLNGQYVR